LIVFVDGVDNTDIILTFVWESFFTGDVKLFFVTVDKSKGRSSFNSKCVSTISNLLRFRFFSSNIGPGEIDGTGKSFKHNR